MIDQLQRLKTALSDRYAIESELGAGGMATVYLADDVKHDRKVAVKVLRPELAAVIGAERFVNEIKVTAHLQHPHILPLHDSGEAEGFLYYVMPRVEGESLRDRLARERQLAVEEALEITRVVASALDYAHRHDVVHRDIKPHSATNPAAASVGHTHLGVPADATSDRVSMVGISAAPGVSNASANCDAWAKRSAGSLDKAFCKTAATCGGTLRRCVVTGTGSSLRIFATTACAFGAMNGGWPASIS